MTFCSFRSVGYGIASSPSLVALNLPCALQMSLLLACISEGRRQRLDSCVDFFDDSAAVLAAPSFLGNGSGTRAETASLASASGEQSSLVEATDIVRASPVVKQPFPGPSSADKLDIYSWKITLCDSALQGLLLELIAELDDNKHTECPGWGNENGTPGQAGHLDRDSSDQ